MILLSTSGRRSKPPRGGRGDAGRRAAGPGRLIAGRTCLLTAPTFAALALSLALLCAPRAALAADGPQPPCGGEAPRPPFPTPGAPPNLHLWHADELPPAWRPPACTGWGGLRFEQLVGLAGRLPSGLRAADVLARLGAISAWTGIRYWSVTRGRCRELIADAHALAGPEERQNRPDFAPGEMVAGRDLYFFQDDNGPGGGAVYRMRLRAVAADRLVLETENVSPITLLMLPLFEPGELRALYVVERDQGAWTYYSLSGATAGVSWFARGHDASYANRALALYAYLAGVDPCTLAAAPQTDGNSWRREPSWRQGAKVPTPVP